MKIRTLDDFEQEMQNELKSKRSKKQDKREILLIEKEDLQKIEQEFLNKLLKS